MSQGSYFDSDGVPGFMQNGPSSPGGVSVVAEYVEVEDYKSEDANEFYEVDRAANERVTINRVAEVASESSKKDKDELIRLRLQMMEIQNFLVSKGLSMPELDKASLAGKSQFNVGMVDLLRSVIGREEFGLPILTNNTDINKESEVNVGKSSPTILDQQKSLYEKGESSGIKEVRAKSWSNVLKSDLPPINKVVFDVPLDKGSEIVSPPDEVLQKRIDKLKCCLVGMFPKGAVSYSIVKDIAFASWKKKGLLLVSQKNETTFVFKFQTKSDKNDVLARGTWYFKNRPMVLSNWGSEPITSLPLWG